MLREIISGVTSGYFQKAIQIVCNILLIPFLISDSALGLDGYGQLAVVLAIVAFLGALFDGWRLSTARRFGLVRGSQQCVYGALAVINIISVLLIALLVLPFSNGVLVVLGLGYMDYTILIYLLVYYFLEQLNVLAEQYFHSHSRTSVVNFTSSIEVAIRTVAIFVVFVTYKPSIEMYLIIFSVLMLLKNIIYTLIMMSDGVTSDLRGLVLGVVREKDTLLYGLPLSVKAISLFSVFRVTILFVNKYVSAEMAAIYSILVVTLRGYVIQIFVAVIRPMVVPLASGINIKGGNIELKKRLLSLLNTYEFLVSIATLVLAFSSPYWLDVWLTQDVSNYHSVFMLGIAIFGLEAMSSFKNLLLISQGLAKEVTYAAIILSILYLVYILLLSEFDKYFSLNTIILGVLMFVMLYSGIVVRWLFVLKLALSEDKVWVRQPLIFLSAILLNTCFYLLSHSVVQYMQLSALVFVVYVFLHLTFIYNLLADNALRATLKRFIEG